MKEFRRLTLGAAVVLALTAVAWAQAKPDFSGSWTMDASKSDPAPAGRGGGRGGRGGGVAAEMTIKQTPSELTIERAMGQGTQNLAYKLDGSESTNAMGRGGEARSKASWEGSKLVITTTQSIDTPNGQMTIESKDVYALDGGMLTLETTRTTPNGTMTRKVVYNKSM